MPLRKEHMCAKYSLPPFDWLKLSHHLVSGESTLHEVTLFEARSRIFLPTAQSCAALFCCRLAIRASSLGWLVGNLILCKVIKLCKSPRSLCPGKHKKAKAKRQQLSLQRKFGRIPAMFACSTSRRTNIPVGKT